MHSGLCKVSAAPAALGGGGRRLGWEDVVLKVSLVCDVTGWKVSGHHKRGAVRKGGLAHAKLFSALPNHSGEMASARGESGSVEVVLFHFIIPAVSHILPRLVIGGPCQVLSTAPSAGFHTVLQDACAGQTLCVTGSLSTQLAAQLQRRGLVLPPVLIMAPQHLLGELLRG